jgi:hypothetical protein
VGFDKNYIKLPALSEETKSTTKIFYGLSKISSVTVIYQEDILMNIRKVQAAERQYKAFSVAYSKVSCQSLRTYIKKMNDPERQNNLGQNSIRKKAIK